MDITTDVILRGQYWEEAISKMKDNIFDSQWKIYALCISIGIIYDAQIEVDSPNDQDKYIPRTVLNHPENSALLDFMFQTAILTSKNVNLSEDDRLYLAFSNEKTDFPKMHFLTKFANYGVKVLCEQISECETDVEIMEVLMTYLNGIYEEGVLDYSRLEDLE